MARIEVLHLFRHPSFHVGVGSIRKVWMPSSWGINLETGHLSHHYIAEISLNVTFNYNKPNYNPKHIWKKCTSAYPAVIFITYLMIEVHFLVHLSRRLMCTIVITRCPSSVRRQSLTFHIFDFSSEITEQNSMKLDRKQDLNIFYQVCVFPSDRKNKMAALASDWLRHFRLLLWNCWTEFNETWQKARSQRPLPSLCSSGRSEIQDGCPGLWLAETFSTSPLKPLKRFQRNLTESKTSTSSTKFVFFGPIGKTRWPPWPLIGWDIFDFSS